MAICEAEGKDGDFRWLGKMLLRREGLSHGFLEPGIANTQNSKAPRKECTWHIGAIEKKKGKEKKKPVRE